jgi:hypothetical protein
MTIESELIALKKIMNSTLSGSVYPSLDHIDIDLSYDGREPYMVYKFYINEPITKENLYDEVDVFWAIDHYVRDYFTKLMPFNKLPIKSNDYQIEVYNSYGIKIFDWIDELEVMHGKNPNSTGGSQWVRMANRNK